MLFGLRNSSETFQRIMNNIFKDVCYIFVFTDDILVFSESEEQHPTVLRKVLLVLEENNLQNSVDEC